MFTKKSSVFTMILYMAFALIFLISLRLYGMGADNSRIRYYALFAVTLVGFISLLIKNHGLNIKKDCVGKELLGIVVVALIFFAFSYRQALLTHYSLNMRTYVQIALFLLPALYVFVLVNLLSVDKVFIVMEFTLVATIIIYFCGSTHTIIDFFNMHNWSKVNIFHSSSFTESSLCSSTFMHLFLFFNYYNSKFKGRNKSIKISTVVSLIFTILAFKRLSIVGAIFFLILGKIKAKEEVPKVTNIAISLVFVFLTYVYFKIMNGDIFQSLNMYKLTSGRDYLLSLWSNHNFLSYGYGSSMLIIGRYLEMDLIQILLELNVFCLFVFCYGFFRIAKHNTYAVLILVYEFLNLLTASSLPNSLSWIVMLLAVVFIASEKGNIGDRYEK